MHHGSGPYASGTHGGAVLPDMEIGRLLTIVWLAVSVPALAEARLEAEALLASPGDLAVRVRFAAGGLLAFLAATGGGDGIPEKVVAGISCPWLAVGPLKTAGLLRLADSPLGFSAAGSAWRERTALEPDDTPAPSRLGAAVSLLPDAFCLYYDREENGEEAGPREAGVFLSVPVGGVLLAEAVLSACGPAVPAAGDAWYESRSRWPGGILGRAAFRTLVLPPSAAVSLAAGASFGGLGAPGAFVHAAAAWQAETASAAALLACSGRDYMAPDGRGPADFLRASLKAALGDPRADGISGDWSFHLAQPGPVPARYLAGRQGLGIALRRVFPMASGCGLVLRGGAERDLRWDADGDLAASASTEAGFGLQADAWNACATMALADDGSWHAGVEASLGAGLSGSAAVRFPEGTVSLDARAGFRFRSHSLSVRAWLEDCPLNADASTALQCAGFSLGWKAREVFATCR